MALTPTRSTMKTTMTIRFFTAQPPFGNAAPSYAYGL
jgi:hypothetical protein